MILKGTLEDMLCYALLYTPSWNKVAKEKVISDKMLKFIQDFGKPKAYVGSGEQVQITGILPLVDITSTNPSAVAPMYLRGRINLEIELNSISLSCL